MIFLYKIIHTLNQNYLYSFFKCSSELGQILRKELEKFTSDYRIADDFFRHHDDENKKYGLTIYITSRRREKAITCSEKLLR